jgi:hypothetical protein
LRHRAADIGRALHGKEAEYATLDLFLDKLRQLFVSPAYREKARACFLSRKQGGDETIIVYHGVLNALYDAAYAPEDRQVAALVRQFTAGLRNPEIVKQLILAKPPTYQEALETALKWEGDLDVIALTLEWQKKGGQGVLTHAIAGNPSTSRAESYGEPMEIGALRQGRGRGRTNRGRQTRSTGRMTPKMANRSRSLTRINKSTNVFAVQTAQQPPSHGNGPHKMNGGTPGRQNTPGTGPCYNCNRIGHWAKECPMPRRNTQRNYRGSNRSVRWARTPRRSQTPQRSGSRTRVLAMNQAKRPQFFGQERKPKN